MTSLETREFSRILLIKPSSLGDVIHALPVLHGLRLRYPRAKIAWLVAKSFAPIIAGHPDLDEIIEFDRRWFGRAGRSLRASGGLFAFVRDLRKRRFELVVDLQGLFRSAFFARASGAPVRIGFRAAREFAWLAYTHRLPPMPEDTHAVDRNYAISRVLGFLEEPVVMDLAIGEAERRDARSLLEKAGVGPQERFVSILPGARWETKRWLPDGFAAVVRGLHQQGSARVVLMGGPDEQEVCADIAGRCEQVPVNLAGRTSLRQLAAVIAESAVVVCHDSGPMHIAAAVGRPMVAISGPTNPRRTGPYGQMDAVLRRDLDCSPCYLRRLSQCRHGHACMKEITADEVLARVSRSLEATGVSVDTMIGRGDRSLTSDHADEAGERR